MRNIHASAVLSKNVELGENIYIGPNCIIGFPGFQFYDDDNEYRHTTIESNTIVMGNSVICLGTLIGGYSRIDYHSFVGEQSRVGRYCVIEYGARIYDNVNIKSNSTISGFIANQSRIGTNSIVQGDLIHKFKNVELDIMEKSPSVGNGCFIGKNALIIGPISIADGSYISAGAIVTKDTNPKKLYKGSPAIEVGDAPNSYLEGVSQFNKKRINEILESFNRHSRL